MQKHFRPYINMVLLFLALGMTSCFDITEEYHFNKDGSGSAKFVIDLAQMMEMMESFAGSMDSLGEGMESMDEMFETTDLVDALMRLPGIRNVKNLSSKDKKVFGYSYDFANLESLNNALVATQGDMSMMSALGMTGGEQDEESANDNIFEKKGKKLTRIFTIPEKEADEESEEDEMAGLASMMFADHFYTFKYSFEGGVKKVKKNKLAVISPDNRTVTIKVPMQNLMEGDADMGAMFKLK